jgi:transposase InsO family protein
VAPFDPAVLTEEIRLLDHGMKRSAGAGGVYARYRESVSRRELAQWVEQVRADLVAADRQNLRWIEWLQPGVVWAMDATEYSQALLPGVRIYLHNTQDLGSRYKFIPMVGEDLVGEEIAGHLSEKFWRYGAPLLLKRDNGGNMNHTAINGELSEFFVLPLNSPKYYAPYNGAIEESQREIKQCLREKLLAVGPPCSHRDIAACAEVATHELNHHPRPCLEGRTSCQSFFAPRVKPVFTKRQRREICDMLREKTERIVSAMNRFDKAALESAWRIAVEAWLRSKGYIKVHIPRKVSPSFAPFLSHN